MARRQEERMGTRWCVWLCVCDGGCSACPIGGWIRHPPSRTPAKLFNRKKLSRSTQVGTRVPDVHGTAGFRPGELSRHFRHFSLGASERAANSNCEDSSEECAPEGTRSSHDEPVTLVGGPQVAAGTRPAENSRSRSSATSSSLRAVAVRVRALRLQLKLQLAADRHCTGLPQSGTGTPAAAAGRVRVLHSLLAPLACAGVSRARSLVYLPLAFSDMS